MVACVSRRMAIVALWVLIFVENANMVTD
jgi:hypothetical protein